MAANADGGNADKTNKCQRIFRQHRLLVLLICLILFGVIVGSLLLFLIPALFKKEPRPYRLPTDVVPYQYGLEIKPYITPGNFWFEGQVEIYVTCARSTDSIVFHSQNLTIDEDSIQVTNLDGDGFKVLLVSYDTTNDLLILRLLENLKARRKYRIYIKYKAPLAEVMEGFYVTSYEDDENVTHYIASTHFEPVAARSAFPCFDEPQFKSTFNITLVRWENMTSLSNMPKLRTENREEHWKADIFEKSMRMSTYLVAFVFCDYVYTTKGKITIWSPKHRKDDAEYAMNVSQKFLQFFESKLEIPYPGPKLDMVPIESWPLAMENWGLIIYDSNSLLTPENETYDLLSTPAASFNQIAGTVAHEIAHQWFGNLVTMKWWSDIWLNEGITTYMGALATAELLAWHQVDTTIANAYERIIADCSESEPIWRPVYSSEDARSSFFGGAYGKGAMVTRMAHQILGEDIFWKGIRRYLNVNAYENVEEADLWRSLTLAQLPGKERLDMAEIMHSWTHVSGIPVVTVNRDYKRRTATISQKSCKSDQKEYENDLWNVPVIVATKYDDNLFDKITWLKSRNMTVDRMPEEEEWIALNGNATGFYIVNYDRHNWKLLFKQLLSNHKIFEPTERFKLLTEIKALFMTENVDIDLLFEGSLYLSEETEAKIIWNYMQFLRVYINHFDEEKYNYLMREFFIKIWKNMYEKYGWVDKDGAKLLTLDEILVGYLSTAEQCNLEYAPCLEEASSRYSKLRTDKVVMTERVNTVNWIALCMGVRNVTYKEWIDIKDTHFNEQNYDNLSFALRCSRDATIIREELNADVEGNMEYPLYFLISSSQSEIAFNEVLNFVDKHFDKVNEKEFSLHERGKQWANDEVKVSRIRKMINMVSKHLKDMNGSKAENMESFVAYLKDRLPVLEKQTEILKKWLEEKPWR